MKTNTRLILKVLYIVSWVIFVGLCVEAGGYLVNAFFAMANPGIVDRLWKDADLSDLFRFDNGHFCVMNLAIFVVSGMKAWLFYLIIKNLHGRKLDIAQPFRKEVRRFITWMSLLALLIGLFSFWGATYAEWLAGQGVKMPDEQHLRLSGADVWLFMSVILFVIAQLFKRGIEIQTENELTI
ncbi:DUF2975 domain-containing protein [Taibaiella koreensis]|uniref:DUF2975 domain-containing protein n=1 Tax=Taibaiella koreensis TaxID=1268548 RepID=UPI000E59A01A|nr:DUF2975 domain-containing protein [Taibaiella koreensis]